MLRLVPLLLSRVCLCTMNGRLHRWLGQRLDFLSAVYSIRMLCGLVPPERPCNGTVRDEVFADCCVLWTMHADAGTEAVLCRSLFPLTAVALLQACATGREKVTTARASCRVLPLFLAVHDAHIHVSE